jgi:hypothetical protein
LNRIPVKPNGWALEYWPTAGVECGWISNFAGRREYPYKPAYFFIPAGDGGEMDSRLIPRQR